MFAAKFSLKKLSKIEWNTLYNVGDCHLNGNTYFCAYLRQYRVWTVVLFCPDLFQYSFFVRSVLDGFCQRKFSSSLVCLSQGATSFVVAVVAVLSFDSVDMNYSNFIHKCVYALCLLCFITRSQILSIIAMWCRRFVSVVIYRHIFFFLLSDVCVYFNVQTCNEWKLNIIQQYPNIVCCSLSISLSISRDWNSIKESNHESTSVTQRKNEENKAQQLLVQITNEINKDSTLFICANRMY